MMMRTPLHPLSRIDSAVGVRPPRRDAVSPLRRGLLLLPLLAAIRPALAAAPARIDVWKDAACGCCNDWIAHLRAQGYAVTARDDGNGEARRRLGMPSRYGSCHTAVVGGYVLEGHVPAREIRRLLQEKPEALGLAVPGMPVGSPGMDGPAYGGRRDPYDVLLVARSGSATVYQSYR